MSDTNEVPIKKKRGRKPKPKTETELNNQETKIPKKR